MKPMLINKLSFKTCCRAIFTSFLILAVSACVSTGSSNTRISKPTEVKKEEVTKNDKAMIHTKLARGYMEQKQYATAKEQLEKALRISPSHSPSNYVMALLMIKLEQLPQAEQYFEKAVNSDRENSSAAHDFGVFLCQTGKVEKAIPYFEIAVSNPLFEHPELSYMRAGECLSTVNDSENAEKYLKKALSIDRRLRPALLRLAKVKFDTKNYLSARAYVERYFAITEPQPDSLLLAYKIESSLNASDVAAKYRSELLRNFPGSAQAREIRESSRP